MDFTVMGTISSYVKRKNLTFAAKHKIKTGQTLINANGNWSSTNVVSTFDKLRQAAKTSTDQAKQERLRRIKQKLRGGQKLSDEELGFLRVNDPKTYKKAKHADEAREELKSELKKAKSKSEAREAMTRAMVKASADAMAELSALGQGGGTAVAGGQGSAAITAGGETSANVDGGENFSAQDGANNQTIQVTGEPATTEINHTTNDAQKNSDAKKISSSDKNSSAQKNSPEDIMEKYLWTVRALEDEWARFTNSDDYKNLPEHLIDESTGKNFHRQVSTPNRRLLNAATAYRRAMHNLDVV